MRCPRHPFVLLPLLLVWPLLVGFGPPSLTESDEARLPLGPAQLAALRGAQPPVVPARAALLMDLAWGRTVYQRNEHQRLAPASLTKIMTAVVALRHGNLNQVVTVRPSDLVEGSTMGLRSGDRLTLEQLLWGLLLPSGNDAAEAIARTVGDGSVATFIEMMNAQAQELHLGDTHFVNAHGLDAPGHYSTAADLALLARYALRFPLFAQIVATRETVIQASRTFTLTSTNPLYGHRPPVPGVTGVKTGTTDDAGESLIASLDRDGHPILVVVLGASDRAAAAITLIDYAYGQFTWVAPSAVMRSLLSPSYFMPQDTDSPVMVPSWERYYLTEQVATGRRLPSDVLPAPAALLTLVAAGSPLARLPVYGSP